MRACIQELITKGSLVRLTVIQAKGVKRSMPVRILHFHSEQDQLSVYHVDEKQVYLLNLNEIEELHQD